MRVRIIILELEILEFVIEQRLPAVLDHQPRERARLTRKLQARLFEMIRVKVAVAARPDERAGLEAALTRQHMGQEGVGGNVERHAEEDVGATLVKLEVEPPRRNLRLE